jgi:tyrosyl-tRNA synthetase
MTIDEQLTYLTKGCVDVVRRDDLRNKLVRSQESGKPLLVKVGFDPTAPDLHLGHTVLLRKMKHFQDLGHTVVFLIGVFTGLIGDPTGRSKTRPPLTREEIDANAETYKRQVFKVLHPEKTVVDFNNRWLEALSSVEWVRLAARYNLAQMLERREFKQRYEAGQPIALHEFLYPLSQAYDSVFLEADVEMGGTDQLFNLNVGRDIMPSYGLPPQVVLTTPLLVGLDGKDKMSKSLGNYIGVDEPASTMFGKMMSISDELMWTYYELLTDLTPAAVTALHDAVGRGETHPREAKVRLARQIVTDFHSAADAEAAHAEFDRVFVRKEVPTDVPQVTIEVAPEGLLLRRVLVDLGAATSMSDATRKVAQGGVRVDGHTVSDLGLALTPGSYLLQVGKRVSYQVRVNPVVAPG